MLLVACVTLSLAGFLLLARGRGGGAAVAAAWIGAGLGVATKGAPAVAATVQSPERSMAIAPSV